LVRWAQAWAQALLAWYAPKWNVRLDVANYVLNPWLVWKYKAMQNIFKKLS
jgi:hypothetical protein